MLNVKIGCDPELFLRDPITGAFISGHDVLPGTKAAPFKVNRGAVQIDGTALEFNTDPADSCDEFITNIATVMAEMQRIAGADRHIVAVPVAEYDPEYFKTIPPSALELGCTPDFNAWTYDMNPMPDGERTMRTGSGHVHIGWGDFDQNSEEHFLACAQLCRQLDYYVGIESLKWDPDNTRRQLYGMAGAMRPKPYGAEYRVLSNAWLNSEKTQRFVYNATVKAIQDLFAGIDKGAEFGDKARYIIDHNITEWSDHYDFGTGVCYEAAA